MQINNYGMLLHERYATFGTIISTAIAVIGTAAALAYYISISRYNAPFWFLLVYIAYFAVIALIYGYFKWKLENVN